MAKGSRPGSSVRSSMITAWEKAGRPGGSDGLKKAKVVALQTDGSVAFRTTFGAMALGPRSQLDVVKSRSYYDPQKNVFTAALRKNYFRPGTKTRITEAQARAQEVQRGLQQLELLRRRR